MTNENSQIACPKCGSTQLTANKKGFSGGKAVAGAVVTGGIGLLAGTIGSNKVVITCLACGFNFKPGEGKIIQSKQGDVQTGDQIPEIDQMIIDKIKSAGMLMAVKTYKDFSGVSLFESKKFVDDIADKYKVKPEVQGKGCASVLLILFAITGLFAYIIFG